MGEEHCLLNSSKQKGQASRALPAEETTRASQHATNAGRAHENRAVVPAPDSLQVQSVLFPAWKCLGLATLQ